ncbi:MAG: hypothetical protein KF901_00190 [Myxococcales bacterium]|nr:hypothetical protein [Myxococcales bacterium]
MRRFSLLVFVLVACSRGAGAPEPRSASAPEVEPPPPTYASPVTEGTIAREELLPILEAGLGRFLQGVETEPHLDGGAFVGFRLRRLYPEDARFAGLDLGPGDTIVRVNASPIERPEQALAVWNGLRVASELVVEYRRDGEERSLRFAIVD